MLIQRSWVSPPRACHGRLKATSPMIVPQPFSPPRRYDSGQALDQVTQTAMYFGPDGRPLQAAQHRKTRKGTERKTAPMVGPDGTAPGRPDHEQDEVQQQDS